MIELTLSKRNSQQLEIEEKLAEMSLARRVEVDTSSPEPVLKHGEASYEGHAEISAYLSNLEGLVGEWCRCHCD